jgi:hypothetical protein
MTRDRIAESIKAGSNYLRRQLLSGNYGLSCIGNNNLPKFSYDKGHLFSLFHMVPALKSDMNEMERTIVLTRILSEEYDGQWGYSPRGYYKETTNNPFFVDADDTSFALRTLRELNVYRSNDILLKYFGAFQDGKGYSAFSTFLSKLPLKKLTSFPSFENNFHIHPEVNANVYHALLDSNHEELINEKVIELSQQENGSWFGYFYPNQYYSTLQFMSLLNKTGRVEHCFAKGIKFLTQTQNENGSWGDSGDAYLSAMALKGLCMKQPASREVEKGVEYLLDNIQAEGSWSTNQNIWKFCDSEGDVWQAYDKNHVIATSLCVDALKTYMNIERR